MQEIWKSLKDIVECGDNYEVSNMGRVRSVDRKVNSWNGGRVSKGIILKTWINRYDYEMVTFQDTDTKKSYGVHRLVALAFIPNPDNKPEVNHEDGNKVNNNVENLTWATFSENRKHAFETGLQYGVKGQDNVNAKLTDEKVIELFEKYKTNNYSMQQLADKYDSSLTVVSTIINGTAWTHLNLGTHKRDMSKKSIITDELIKKVKELKELGYSKRKIEREVGVSRTTVTKILDGNY